MGAVTTAAASRNLGGAGGGGGGGGGGGAFSSLSAADGDGAGAGGRGYVVLLLSPAFEDGTLAEELQRLAAAGARMGTQDVLDVFEQVGWLGSEQVELGCLSPGV